MKRRDFMLRSSSAALLGAMPLAASATWRGPLLDDPQAWIGREFRLADGSVLSLHAVEALPSDGRSTQFRLQFRTFAGASPREGSHALRCGFDEEVLFLQPGSAGPVACINRLNRSA
jgi:hypothetical protein